MMTNNDQIVVHPSPTELWGSKGITNEVGSVRILYVLRHAIVCYPLAVTPRMRIMALQELTQCSTVSLLLLHLHLCLNQK